MRRTKVLLAAASVAMVGLLALPAETTALPPIPDRPAPAVARSEFVDARTDCPVVVPKPAPFPSRYMSQFEVTHDGCFGRSWLAKRWVDGSQSARGLFVQWRSLLRTDKYHTTGRAMCGAQDGKNICFQELAGVGTGLLWTGVGPIRDDGRRLSWVSVKITMNP